ncbi:voltage-dependent calcium channel subunit alpha-2/delta-3-like [Rhynchophorus ferrugineus]
MSREDEVRKSFKSLENHLYTINGISLIETVANRIRTFMQDKIDAVKKIADYAEFLSYYRNTDKKYQSDSLKYFFYDTDEIQHTDKNFTRTQELTEDVFLMECHWWCHQKDLKELHNNIFTKERLKDLFGKRTTYENEEFSCDCDNLMDLVRSTESYQNLPMEEDVRFSDKINLNVSVIKVATNIYERDKSVLGGIKWSEPLDLIFKQNFLKDQELTWQYFASPLGFMRHYPAVKWSQERYHQTYDFRTRSWFTEAMTSPKDIIILLDRSGSMKGKKRALSLQIVNDILDTLNDNDFVNIFTFSNSTLPLVDCFSDTLFQANEENLRLLRENLPVYELEFVANITLGIEKAFETLKDFRETRRGSNCNQAIMLITEGIDYEYDINIFNRSNWQKDFPVRIFTYLLSTDRDDEKHMEFIACSNMGYYVNMTLKSDIREKILQYLPVMSRPINFDIHNKQVPIWSYLYVDLADRRLSNWLWTKFEGIRQREVFLDHSKRRVDRLQLKHKSQSHMLLQESHEFEKYEEKEHYNYMTTVSLPVYGRRDDEYNLIGVAGLDVPIKLFRTRIPHETIGVNGYAFIITNNGYILMHPEHRTEFEYILKPTFNRVDILETEILDDENEPRIFGEAIVKLREQMLKRQGKEAKLKIKYTLDDMKRIVRATRHYYFTEIGPFTLCIVLPEKYGFVKANKTSDLPNLKDPNPDFILNNRYWDVHPDWTYCRNCPHVIQDRHRKIQYAYYHPAYRTKLYNNLMYDLKKTSWFDNSIPNEHKFVEPYYVHKIFVSTNSGLTRWKIFNSDIYQSTYDQTEESYGRGIDEDWYQRSVEENFIDEDMFIFSVPFEISGYENNTMIRGTKAIFLEKQDLKTPIAVIGLEFNHQAMYKLYNSITTKSRRKKGDRRITCESDYLNCFILDNNAYILLSDEIEYTGRFIGDIRPDIMYHLVKQKVFRPTRMFDYQATCQLEPPEPAASDEQKCPKKKNSSTRKSTLYKMLYTNIFGILKWVWVLLCQLIQTVIAPSPEQVVKEETRSFVTLKINKTFPTPCDREMWLFTLNKEFPPSFYNNDTTKFSCNWPYVVRRIPKTNLIFLAINGKCAMTTINSYPHMPEPTKISYYYKNNKISLPCYIATMNNYTRSPYMNCYKRDKQEDELNKMNKTHCGHTWK